MSPNTLIDDYENALISKDFSELIHHCSLMLHKRMDIAVERDHRILVTENFGEGFNIHSTFYRSCCECVTESVKAFPRYADLLQQQFKAALIGANGEEILVS